MILRVFALLLAAAFATSADARVDVRSLPSPKPLFELKRKSMYAVGTAENSNETITIVNGRIYVTRYEAKKAAEKPILHLTESFQSLQTRATRLIYANVISWTEAQLSGEIRTPANLGPLINKILKDTGYERAGQFPFLIKGKISSLQIADGRNAAALKISAKQVNGIIVGFLTKGFVESQVQPGTQVADFKLEMHFVDDAGKTIGAVEDFHLEATNKAALFLPR